MGDAEHPVGAGGAGASLEPTRELRSQRVVQDLLFWLFPTP